jgi:hypothetical protein
MQRWPPFWVLLHWVWGAKKNDKTTPANGRFHVFLSFTPCCATVQSESDQFRLLINLFIQAGAFPLVLQIG